MSSKLIESYDRLKYNQNRPLIEYFETGTNLIITA